MTFFVIFNINDLGIQFAIAPFFFLGARVPLEIASVSEWVGLSPKNWEIAIYPTSSLELIRSCGQGGYFAIFLEGSESPDETVEG